MGNRHVIVYDGPERTLVDRRTLAFVIQRPVSTIRARCEVAEYRHGRALYDLNAARHTLADVPSRGHTYVALRT